MKDSCALSVIEYRASNYVSTYLLVHVELSEDLGRIEQVLVLENPKKDQLML